MPTIGDVWKVALGDNVRTVKVVAPTELPDWWRCVDAETGVSFLASERRFFEPVNEKGPPIGSPSPRSDSDG
jgi:hypothetical protein